MVTDKRATAMEAKVITERILIRGSGEFESKGSRAVEVKVELLLASFNRS